MLNSVHHLFSDIWEGNCNLILYLFGRFLCFRFRFRFLFLLVFADKFNLLLRHHIPGPGVYFHHLQRKNASPTPKKTTRVRQDWRRRALICIVLSKIDISPRFWCNFSLASTIKINSKTLPFLIDVGFIYFLPHPFSPRFRGPEEKSFISLYS